MTGPATWTDGARFFKRYPSADLARRALDRSRAARAALVPTPLARPGPQADVVIFDRILPVGPGRLEDLLYPLAALRSMPGDGLPAFDPFLRITPRLAAAPPGVQAMVERLRQRDRELGWHAQGVCHGDFHPGQVLCDRDGTAWLVDLDDLARGPVEADLGNLAAWMATQTPGPLSPTTTDSLGRIGAAWGERRADPVLMAHFCSIALVRRALKLQGRGITWVLDNLPSVA